MEAMIQTIQSAYADPIRCQEPEVVRAIHQTIELLDSGQIRVAEKKGRSDGSSGSSDGSSGGGGIDGSNGGDGGNGGWLVNEWVKQAILLYFRISPMQKIPHGPFEYYDKLPLKQDFDRWGVRVVPPATIRRGAFVERGAILMPSYVNIGAYVGAGTMVDTWATVGSCAQIGKNVHLSGGVGIGGVLEPPSARPVIVEDGAFVGSRCIVVEGVVIEEQAVLAANVSLTASTDIIDVTGSQPIIYRGRVPARSVVVPGTRPKEFPAGTYQISCALIIGQRKASTDEKTSLNQTLREFGIAA